MDNIQSKTTTNVQLSDNQIGNKEVLSVAFEMSCGTPWNSPTYHQKPFNLSCILFINEINNSKDIFYWNLLVCSTIHSRSVGKIEKVLPLACEFPDIQIFFRCLIDSGASPKLEAS